MPKFSKSQFNQDKTEGKSDEVNDFDKQKEEEFIKCNITLDQNMDEFEANGGGDQFITSQYAWQHARRAQLPSVVQGFSSGDLNWAPVVIFLWEPLNNLNRSDPSVDPVK